jgi:hypothetical protein
MKRIALKTGLSWEDTAREMAAETEDWSVWDSASGDGLDMLPWDRKPRTRRVSGDAVALNRIITDEQPGRLFCC